MIDVQDFCEALVESSDVAIAGKNLSGTVIVWNSGATQLFGYTAQEMVGQDIRRLLPDDRRDEEEALLARIRTGERIAPFITPRLHKSGRLIHVAISASPVRDNKGGIIGISTIARDAGAWLEQQRLLRESEERFRMLADNIAQFAWIAEPDGQIVWFNKRAYEYTDLPPEELVGWGFVQLFHPDDIERVPAAYREAAAEGREWEDTYRLRRADGQYRWFLARAKPVRDEAGQIAWWIGTNTDVTGERERAEQISMLLMEVNHRSKNLLSTVQALARRSAPGEDGFAARFEERIRSLAINQDILVRREWREVPLAELAREQLAFVEGAPGEVRISGISCSLVPRAAEAVGMALHELATNSLKYGALSVKGGHVEVRWSCLPGTNTFEIRWQESGGPEVIPPTRQGFGTTLIRDVPRHNLGCEVNLDYNPAGVCWSLRCDECVLVKPVCTTGA
jgi:PAS domain S-box-containing protein